VSTPLEPAPLPKARPDPDYKPQYRPRPLRDAATALATTLGEYAALMRLHRPIGIWLLMWPALWALWIAGDGRPGEHAFIIFMAGVLVMRSAGCVINDYADRDFDPHVRRTAERPLASGRVTRGEALTLFVALGLVASWLALQLQPLARLYAVAGAVLAVTYPFMKRFVQLPQFYLGAAFAWSIPMAFAELTDAVPRLGWLMVVAVVLWAAVYDTMYAMVDREDDLKLGLKSTAILFGDADRVVIGTMQAMTLLALWLVGREAGLGGWYQAGVGAGAAIFAWEQWLIRDRDPERCFQAFNNNHYFGLIVFVGLALDYLFR
jgi:4-hydroxybenzoate polyprenyltransferase